MKQKDIAIIIEMKQMVVNREITEDFEKDRINRAYEHMLNKEFYGFMEYVLNKVHIEE
jgi:hypothetical protein